MYNSLVVSCKRLLHNHNKKVTKEERDLCYFENYPLKKTCVFNVAHLLSTSVLIERIKILVASWLVAKLPGGEMTGNQMSYSSSVLITPPEIIKEFNT